ncbi:hypothetical protein BDF14DRAFT_1862113 [Spinellus fusiger]|nr:hypothetical protein BDF14DRAFT_1862113 [Spinellus fusiger]
MVSSPIDYTFEPPPHWNRIRTIICQRSVHKRHHMATGLPSPPTEAQPAPKQPLQETITALDLGPSLLSEGTLLSEQAITERLRMLKEEKHRLFQLFKQMSQQPVPVPSKETLHEHTSCSVSPSDMAPPPLIHRHSNRSFCVSSQPS